jgi:uracil-DNA glycosylase
MADPRTKPLDGFLADLAQLTMAGCFNPWRETCPELDCRPKEAVAGRVARLRAHFGNPGIQVLLVGEAPGYQGARYSGLAFTSERLLLEGGIPGVPRPQVRLTLRPRPFSEPSATILWGAFRDLGIHERVALWNAFPLHPFKPGDPLSNRTPTRGELEVGGPFVRRLLEEVLPKGVRLVAIGEKAASTLRGLGFTVPSDHCLRHPANGGATAFRQGIARLFPGGRGALPLEGL